MFPLHIVIAIVSISKRLFILPLKILLKFWKQWSEFEWKYCFLFLNDNYLQLLGEIIITVN